MAEKTPEEMREAVLAIREKMAAAAREAGRDPAEVQLCAACKTRTAETVAASAALPIDVFGENHVQELCANFDAGAYCGKPSHFIGHLQTNKIKKVLGRAERPAGGEHRRGGEQERRFAGSALAPAGCRCRTGAHPGQGPDGHSPGQ